MPIRILIVDDEPLGILGVRTLLDREQDVEIVGECLESEQAPEMVRNLRPDLIFLDVQMPVLDGFGVLEELRLEELPLVVFVTAYDRYSIQAFEVHALDYVLKPLNRERFRLTMERARRILAQRNQNEMSLKLQTFLEEAENRRKNLFRFVVRSGDRVQFIKASDVEAIQATGNYMHLYRGRESFLLRETLTNLEGRLNTAQFIRTHRSWVANMEKITEIRALGECEYVLQMDGGLEVPVSRRYRHRFAEILRNPIMDKELQANPASR